MKLALPRRWPLYAGLGVLGLLLFRSGYSFGGAELRAGVNRDPQKLLPGFAKKLDKLFSAMRARGFEPLLWEGYRTPERAAQLAKQGTGVADSMHSYGAAADVVDGSRADYWSASPGFWTALGEESKKLGLTWGGTFSSKDYPHVQAVTVAQQSALRAATPAERLRMVA